MVGDYVSHYASRALAGHAKIESENDLWVTKDVGPQFGEGD